MINKGIIPNKRNKISDKKSDVSQKRKIKLTDNRVSSAMIMASISIMIILWVLSKVIEFPITHQDYQSGNFYVGFMGFIDYFNLRLLLYTCILLWVIGWSLETIYKVHLVPRESEIKKRKKINYLYLIRWVILILGSTVFIYGMLKPWKFGLNMYSILLIGGFIAIIVCLSMYIKYLKNKFN